MRFVRIAIASVAVAFATPLWAAPAQPFTESQFEQAQKANQPILVDITASWCPTCAAQKPIIEHLTSEPQFDHLVVFRVDFDSQKDVVRRFHAISQSTLIVFKGRREAARSVGDTSEGSIEQLLLAAAGT
ncbi:MAG: thioredoxin family protein [Proteobacteria bacterium]|nr:thioredoxin family protein [Pseudomonadota bacterium]